jgi:hypothetical protein
MLSRERRISPRKHCVVELRFRVVAGKHQPAQESAYFGTVEGESVNLSERGIYFRSQKKMTVGQPLEMYFTIPRELTGRTSERVRCSARVVHVESRADTRGMVGVGAAVERFEPMSATRDWDN